MLKLIEEAANEPASSRIAEYDEYLTNHINGVIRSWQEVLNPFLLDSQNEADLEAIATQISKHDASKYEDEYIPYLNYFYPESGEPSKEDEVKFDLAWLHHQKVNSHHWQYHVIIRDNGELAPMDMPFADVCEMLCDWHSFSLKNPESTAYTWYQKNKDKMIFSDNTRKLIEEYIDVFKEPLTNNE